MLKFKAEKKKKKERGEEKEREAAVVVLVMVKTMMLWLFHNCFLRTQPSSWEPHGEGLQLHD